MLRLAACLEEHYPHSMANAVVEEVKAPEPQTRGDATPRWNMWWPTAFPAGSMVKRLSLAVITSSSRTRAAWFLPEDQAKFDALPPQYSHLYLAVGGTLAAVICIEDPLRQEAKEVIRPA